MANQAIPSPSNGSNKIWNFYAPHIEILAKTADLFEIGDDRSVERAMELFSRMPKGAKDGVYGELFNIVRFTRHYWGCAEHAFYNLCGQVSSLSQRAQAVSNYLKSLS